MSHLRLQPKLKFNVAINMRFIGQLAQFQSFKVIASCSFSTVVSAFLERPLEMISLTAEQLHLKHVSALKLDGKEILCVFVE